MSGTVWDQLRDFKLATGDYHILRDPRVVNLAGYNRYLFHTILMNNITKAIQGGDEINYSMFFDVGDTYSHPLPAAFRQYKRVDNVYEAKQRWAKDTDHKTWIRDEVVRNRSRGGKAWFDVFFDMDRKLEQRLQVSRDKGLEDDISKVPAMNTMEDRTFQQEILPASLFFHVNEDAYGLYGQTVTGSSATSFTANSGVASPVTQKQLFAMTSAAQLAIIGGSCNGTTGMTGKTTTSKFSPYQLRYTANTVNSEKNLFAALRSAHRHIQWDGPTDTRQWYETTQMNNFRVVTSDLGCRVLEDMIKQGQDRWVLGPQDMGIPDVQLHGIPIKWWPKLDAIALYDGSTHTTKVDEISGDDKGPRFYGFNFNTLYPVVHEEMWRYRESMPPHFNVPDVFVEYIEDWWNSICEDYRQHFVVSPLGSMYS